MKRLRFLTLPVLAALAFVAADLRPTSVSTDGGKASLSIGVSEAEAQTYRAHARRTTRRVARRTTRRTVNRQAYLRSLPGGCALRGGYHYCGGVYYRPVVQGGATVYVVVNP